MTSGTATTRARHTTVGAKPTPQKHPTALRKHGRSLYWPRGRRNRRLAAGERADGPPPQRQDLFTSTVSLRSLSLLWNDSHFIVQTLLRRRCRPRTRSGASSASRRRLTRRLLVVVVMGLGASVCAAHVPFGVPWAFGPTRSRCGGRVEPCVVDARDILPKIFKRPCFVEKYDAPRACACSRGSFGAFGVFWEV